VVRNVSKRYDDPPVQANEDISFQVEAGEAFGLLGPNGAGKTTLVRQLVGLLRPTSGEIRLMGEAVRAGTHDPGIGRRVAYLPQGALSLGELEVQEAVRYTAMLRGLGASSSNAETEELLATLQLEGIRDRQLRKLSGGQRRLVQLGMTFVGRCPVLILDEPTADIDVALRQRVWDLITQRVQEGAAVILVTHDVAEAERALQRVAILDRGQIVAGGTPAELKARLAHRTRLELVLTQEASLRADDVAGEVGGEYRVRGRRITAWVSADYALTSLEKVLSSFGPEAFEDVHMVTPTLADVYLELGGRSLEEADEAR
jgi:ABC-type multidrug transport system ATPase subunit